MIYYILYFIIKVVNILMLKVSPVWSGLSLWYSGQAGGSWALVFGRPWFVKLYELLMVRFYRALVTHKNFMLGLEFSIWLVFSFGNYLTLTAPFKGDETKARSSAAKSRETLNLVSRSWLRNHVPDFTGMLAVKGGLPLLPWFLRIAKVVVGTLTPSWIRVSLALMRDLHRMRESQGVAGVVKYLKASSVLLQQSVGGYRIKDPSALGPKVSRTGSGLPRIIPAQMRRRIREGEIVVIKFWLSLFSVYRVLSFPGRLKISTITSPGVSLKGTFEEYSSFLDRFFIPWMGSRVPLPSKLPDDVFQSCVAAEPFPILKSSPSSGPVAKSLGVKSLASSSFASVADSAFSIWKNPNLRRIVKNYAELTGNLWVLARVEELALCSGLKSPGYIGKLGTKEEPAGKVRVFAMVDPWTQWLLEPIHKYLFGFLRKVPTDGTFNQMGPVDKLVASKATRFWSYDLSAATDRLPVTMQALLLEKIFGRGFGLAWQELLVKRDYKCPHGAGQLSVRYAVGQPMGALSSWAMLAMTHHALVQWAAFRVERRRNKPLHRFNWFKQYAVLGDDVVIADGSVAREYLGLMRDIGVDIGLAKSIVGTKPVLEFAKRFIVCGADASPVSFLELAVARCNITSLVQFGRKFNLSPAAVLSLLDYRHKVLGGMHKAYYHLSGRVSAVMWSVVRERYSFLEWVQLVSLAPRFQRFRDCEAARVILRSKIQSLIGRMSAVAKVVYFMIDRASQRSRETPIWAEKETLVIAVPHPSGELFRLEDPDGKCLLGMEDPVTMEEIEGWANAHSKRLSSDWLRSVSTSEHISQFLTVNIIKGAFIHEEVERKVRMLKERLEEDDLGYISVNKLWAELEYLDDRLSQVALVKDVDFRQEVEPDRDSVLMHVKILRQIKAAAIHWRAPLALVPHKGLMVRFKGWWKNLDWSGRAIRRTIRAGLRVLKRVWQWGWMPWNWEWDVKSPILATDRARDVRKSRGSSDLVSRRRLRGLWREVAELRQSPEAGEPSWTASISRENEYTRDHYGPYPEPRWFERHILIWLLSIPFVTESNGPIGAWLCRSIALGVAFASLLLWLVPPASVGLTPLGADLDSDPASASSRVPGESDLDPSGLDSTGRWGWNWSWIDWSSPWPYGAAIGLILLSYWWYSRGGGGGPMDPPLSPPESPDVSGCWQSQVTEAVDSVIDLCETKPEGWCDPTIAPIVVVTDPDGWNIPALITEVRVITPRIVIHPCVDDTSNLMQGLRTFSWERLWMTNYHWDDAGVERHLSPFIGPMDSLRDVSWEAHLGYFDQEAIWLMSHFL